MRSQTKQCLLPLSSCSPSYYWMLRVCNTHICIPRLGHFQAGWFTPGPDLHTNIEHSHTRTCWDSHTCEAWRRPLLVPVSNIIPVRNIQSVPGPDRPDPPCHGARTAVESQMLKYRLFTFNPELRTNQTRPGWAGWEGRRGGQQLREWLIAGQCRPG